MLNDITLLPLTDGNFRLAISSDQAREILTADYPAYLDGAELTADECDDLIDACRYERLTVNGWRVK